MKGSTVAHAYGEPLQAGMSRKEREKGIRRIWERKKSKRRVQNESRATQLKPRRKDICKSKGEGKRDAVSAAPIDFLLISASTHLAKVAPGRPGSCSSLQNGRVWWE